MEIKNNVRFRPTLPGIQGGVTLIELVIVIAILAILASLAMPGYQDYVLRTNRMEAINMVLEVAACQERTYTRENRYDIARCGLTAGAMNAPNDEYRLQMVLNRGGLGDQAFTLTAIPLGRQVNDSCGAMSLTDIGGRGAASAGSDEQIDNCWKGRKI